MSDGGPAPGRIGSPVADSGADGVADGARILDGRRLARQMYTETAARIRELGAGRRWVPAVAVVMVGEDPASRVYVRQIMRAAERVGAVGRLVELPAQASPEQVQEVVGRLNEDEAVGGVIFQLPLPGHMAVRTVAAALDPIKDIDGIHTLNAGLVSQGEGGFAPSCAEAAITILKRHDVPLAGRRAVVIGRSNVVGRPAQLLLIREHATVTVCHRQTRELDAELRAAEIVIVAAGSPGLVRGEAIRPGAVVIDCGVNVLANGSITGDVDLPSVARVAGAVTPVPGGVGPVTNAVLMDHLARALRARRAPGSLGHAVARSAW